MKPRTIGQHALVFLLIAALPSLSEGQDIPVVKSQAFDIEYGVNEAALPLLSVRLWYTTDGGAQWQESARDEDRIPPIRFRSPGEGLYGFFLVITNSTGSSSAPPSKNTPPQQMALVDYTPPLVQLHQVRAIPGVDEVTVQIRWTAVDHHFPYRPIEILYGVAADQVVNQATAEPVANTGMYDWRVPPELSGSVAIRIAATDRAGHRAESDLQWVELRAAGAPSGRESVVPATQHPGLDDSALAGTSRAKERAVQLFSLALEDGKNGQLADGISKLREAVKLDPNMPDAFAQMGGMLYLLGDLDRATDAYELALAQQPGSREALRGMAKISERKGEMPAAVERLQMILRSNPKDAEIWLQLGDVAVHQGDEIRARECYVRASQIDPQASAVIADAQQRLALMAEVSRNPSAKK